MGEDHNQTKVKKFITLFFIFLTIALFMGDGKQPLVDIFGAISMVGFMAYAYKRKIHLRPNNAFDHWLWIILICWFFLSTFISWSVGYSIYTLVRMVEAYLIYTVFSSLSPHVSLPVFSKLLLIYVFGATIIAFLLIPFYYLANFLPEMNLLYARYGHNYLASLCVVIFPIVLVRLRNDKSTVSRIGFVTLVGGLVFSFSRGAFVLLGVSLLIFLVATNNKIEKWRPVIVGTIILLCSVLILFGARFYKEPATATQKTWLMRQIEKPLLFDRGRIEYWKQAIQAIAERPLNGFGPGTFSLVSRRLRTGPIYSTFAHSFPFEILAEVGVAGGLLFIGVLFPLVSDSFSLVQRPYIEGLTTKETGILQGLAAGTLLTVLYSFYEINLNFLVVWCLFWALLGIVRSTRFNKPHESNRSVPLFMWVCFIFLVIFSATATLGSFLALGTKNPSAAMRIAPYQRNVAFALIRMHRENGIDLQGNELTLIARFYNHDSELLYEIGRIKEIAGDRPEAYTYYRSALQSEPQRIDFRRQLVDDLLQDGRIADVKHQIEAIGFLYLAPLLRQRLHALDLQQDGFDYRYEILRNLGQTTDGKMYLSKFLYIWGLFVERDSQKRSALWTLARDISPEWGHFYIELASLQQYVLFDKTAALITLRQCQEVPVARRQCEDAERDGLEPPGSLLVKIRAIPTRDTNF